MENNLLHRAMIVAQREPLLSEFKLITQKLTPIFTSQVLLKHTKEQDSYKTPLTNHNNNSLLIKDRQILETLISPIVQIPDLILNKYRLYNP